MRLYSREERYEITGLDRELFLFFRLALRLRGVNRGRGFTLSIDGLMGFGRLIRS
jgi:hypothetical protein